MGNIYSAYSSIKFVKVKQGLKSNIKDKSYTGKGNYTGTIQNKFKISIMKSSTYTINGMKYKVTNAKTDGKVDMF